MPVPGRFSARAAALSESATHGTKALVDSFNDGSRPGRPLIDLGIGALDHPTDPRIAGAIAAVHRCDPALLHAFAPVRGHLFLREAIAARIERLHGLRIDPEEEVLVTPGGAKGALTVAFHAFLEPGDEVLVPVPNWPHYMDMVRLHGAVPRQVRPSGDLRGGLTAEDLKAHLFPAVRLLLLGDCVNPTGKVYSTVELERIAAVLAAHNVRRRAASLPSIEVVFDCPYEAHVPSPRPIHFTAIKVELPSGRHRMSEYAVSVSGPGKAYGMHGDRLGFLYAQPGVIDVATRVQANTNSFASVYAQVASHRAMQEDMDAVAARRARLARRNLETAARRLAAVDGINLILPDGAFFLFADLSARAPAYRARGHDSAAAFLLHEAGVATVDGRRFAEGQPDMEHFVRINCGRTRSVVNEACTRIEEAMAELP